MKVVGIEQVDYVSSKSGKRVQGVRLHMSGEFPPASSGAGQRVSSEFVSGNIYRGDIEIGSEVCLYFNKYGSVEHYVLP